ncbi:MAG: ATP-binding protein [Nitrospiraceae bacterium]
MNPFAVSGLLTGLTSLTMGGFVLSKNPDNRLSRLWFLFTGSVAVWGFGGMWIASEPNETIALLAWRIAFAFGVVWIPILFYHFVTILCELRQMNVLLVNYLLGILYFPLILSSSLFFSGVRFVFSSFYYALPGSVLFHIFFGWWCWLVIYAHYQVFKSFRHASGIKRNQFKYFFIAFSLSYLTGSLDYLPIFAIDVYPYGNFGIILYPIIITYAISKYRLMDITVVMEKGLVYLFLLVSLAIPAYIVVHEAQRAHFGEVSNTFSILLLLLFALLIIGAYKIKTKAQVAISRTLFRRRYDMYTTLSDFSKALVTILDLKSLTQEIVNTLVDVIGIKAASLYLLDKEKGIYARVSSYGQNSYTENLLSFKEGDGLPHYLAFSKSILIREELQHSADTRPMQGMLAPLTAMESEVCIPLINKDRLIGFCNLGPRTSRQMYSEEDLNLLTTLAQNAAIALDNAMLYEDLKRSQVLMRRTDRLRSLEIIAGGFAHEIRNPMTSIKTFIQLAPERKDDPEFISEFSKVVNDDVDRIERLIQEILDYARYMEPKLTEEDINEIVASCLYFVAVKADSVAITLEKDLASELPRMMLDRQQIKQVLLNLLLNAMDAMAETGGHLTVRTHRLLKPSGDEWVQIEVTDSGSGISEANLEHIFDPFYTTKHESGEREGTGLGLTIVHQIVQEHRGSIQVESVVGSGTTFFVNLPVSPVQSHLSPVREEHEETGSVGR